MAKTPFNPDSFDIDLKVKDVVEKFPLLLEFDYQKVSLNEELIKLNYEVISPDYEDKKYSSIEEYLEIDLDYIV